MKKTNNLIQMELEASKDYMLDSFVSEVTGDRLVRLTPDNVARAEAMFHTDSAYSAASNPQNEQSSAYMITKMKEYIDNSGGSYDARYNGIISEIVKRLDVENSTHINSDGVGREEITKRIVEIEIPTLLEYLKYPEDTNFELFDRISEKTNPKDGKHHGRVNPSFASKFCHYLCFFMFDGDEYQDNYPIYDSVIRDNLPKYLKHYGLNNTDITDYVVYRQAIDDVIEQSKEKISRNGFDHLVWYFFKGAKKLGRGRWSKIE
ncbi:hypothetical protein [Butyrivibrio sp. YAB3001]|uniref:hypothetical protein n=1 Tax=Butyrivibrio sp. YAB3001 TaxID=1520812 RepID=UPI0008F68EEC|nr:hypothetical protein [Butyrivibrio sp. YAB3001]SFC34377.1 hypothetical protein SAMN02910398_02040 [Butyrivibrio sp. YAB3001]